MLVRQGKIHANAICLKVHALNAGSEINHLKNNNKSQFEMFVNESEDEANEGSKQRRAFEKGRKRGPRVVNVFKGALYFHQRSGLRCPTVTPIVSEYWIRSRASGL